MYLGVFFSWIAMKARSRHPVYKSDPPSFPVSLATRGLLKESSSLKAKYAWGRNNVHTQELKTTQDNRLDTHKHLFQVHVKQTQDRLHIFFQVNARGPGSKYFFLLLQEYPSVLTCNSAAYPRTSPTSWMKSNYKTQLLS